VSLSASTLALFILLIPGFVFRMFLYFRSTVNRAIFSDNAVYSSVAILLQAVAVHVVAVTATGAVAIFYDHFWGWVQPEVLHFKLFSYLQTLEILDFGKITRPMFLCIAVYFLFAVSLAYILAVLVQRVSHHSYFVRRLLYGPLADLMGPHQVSILTAFILTRVTHQHKRLVYAGLPKEIGLREGSKIDYIVLQQPQKFYLQLSGRVPVTSINHARPIGSSGSRSNMLFIAGSEIENVNFESWAFAEQ
jgi:hypothetical protein